MNSLTNINTPKKARNTINLEQKKLMIFYHDTNPHLTQKEIADHFSEVFQLKIACSTLSETLKSRKRLLSVAEAYYTKKKGETDF